MKKEKLFRIVVAVGVLWALCIEGLFGAIVYSFVYAIGRLIAKTVDRKAEDPIVVLIYLSMVCLVFSVIVTIILTIREGGTNYYSLIITMAWLSGTLWRRSIKKTE